MPNRGRILVVLAACIGAAAPIAAGHAGAPIPATRPMYFEHVTMRDGLSMSTVNSILQDSQGYVWFATEAGLNRYDGYAIRQYHRERGNDHGLASDYIWSMAEDAHGDIWLATDGGGVARWQRATDKFQQFRHDASQPRSLASDAVRALLIDAQGRIWAGTKDQGLDMLDPDTGQARHFRHIEGDLYSLPANAIGALYSDRSGRMWVGTDGGLSRYDPSIDGFISYGAVLSAANLSDLRVRAIHEDHAGALWVGTVSGGLVRLEQNGNRFTTFRHDPQNPNSLSQDRVWSVLEDSAQRLWVATADGLDLFDRGIGHGQEYDIPEPNRVGGGAGLGGWPSRGDQVLEFLRMAGRKHHGMTRLDPKPSDGAADMAGADNADLQRRGAMCKGRSRNGKGQTRESGGREKRAAAEAGAVSIGHDFLLKFFASAFFGADSREPTASGRQTFQEGKTPGNGNYSMREWSTAGGRSQITIT